MGSLDMRFARPGLRITRATATLPASTQSALFTVSNGLIALTSLVGVVTVAIQNQACNTKIVSNPTVGNDVDLCAVLNIANDQVGDIYTMTGILSDALVGAGGAAAFMSKPIIVPAGTIDLSTAATNTGSIRWVLHYIPLEAGASVAAA